MHLTPVSPFLVSRGTSESLSQPLIKQSSKLSDSACVIKTVLPAVIEARVRAGDMFIEEVKCAKGDEFCDLAQVINAAPIPSKVDQNDKAKYRASLFEAVVYDRSHPLFNRTHKAPISPGDYVKHWLRLVEEYACTNTFVLGMMYLDIAVSKNPAMMLNSTNALRMILAAFAVAIKMHEDFCYSDTFLSTIAGVTKEELNHVVRAFLVAIDFRCFVRENDFHAYEHRLMEEALCSNDGCAVHVHLLLENVDGLDEAVEKTKRWEKTPISPIESSNSLDDQLESELPQQTDFAASLSYVARILAQFNFPSLRLFPTSPEEKYVESMLLPCYPEAAQRRFKTLRDLAWNQAWAALKSLPEASMYALISPMY